MFKAPDNRLLADPNWPPRSRVDPKPRHPLSARSTQSSTTRNASERRSRSDRTRLAGSLKRQSLVWEDVEVNKSHREASSRPTGSKRRAVRPRSTSKPISQGPDPLSHGQQLREVFPRLSRIVKGTARDQAIEPARSPLASGKGTHSTTRMEQLPSSTAKSLARPVDHASSSLLSVVSGTTYMSKASSGSNSTVTQQPYNPSNTSDPMPEWSCENAIRRGRHPNSIAVEGTIMSRPDILSFVANESRGPPARTGMESDYDGSDGSSVTDQSSVDCASAVLPPMAFQTRRQPRHWKKWDRTNSDSGIVVCGSNLDYGGHILHDKEPQIAYDEHPSGGENREFSLAPPASPECFAKADYVNAPEQARPVTVDGGVARRRWHSEQDMHKDPYHPPQPILGYYFRPASPQLSHSALDSGNFDAYVHPPHSYSDLSSRARKEGHTRPTTFIRSASPTDSQASVATSENATVDSASLSSSAVTGYELLALRLASLAFEQNQHSFRAPLYRKFDGLNHRMLLHLQKELCELEKQLDILDKEIASLAGFPSMGGHPTQTYEALHNHRVDLLGRIYTKLGQYNQVLTPYSNLTQRLLTARRSDVTAYRAWIARHVPLSPEEADFLKHENDLVAVHSGQAAGHRTSLTQAVMCSLAVATILPFFAFSFVLGFYGRLFFTAIIGASVTLVLATRHNVDFMEPRQLGRVATMYFAAMALIAALSRS